jgi:hypothetical protein
MKWQQLGIASVPRSLGLVVVAGLAACSGGHGSSAPPPTYAVGGSVTGLTGTLVLDDNGGDATTLTANGSFSFATRLHSGAAYSVTVATQPATQTCAVTGGKGTVAAANVTTVAVSCGPTPEDLVNAKAAKLVASYSLTSHMATLSWKDAFPTTSGFQIQRQASNGSWTTLETLPGATGTGQTLTWTGAVTTPTTLRVEAVLSGYTVPLQTASAQMQLTVSPPLSAPTLNVGTAPPIAAPTVLSIGNAGTYTQAAYFVDSTAIGTSTTAPGYPVDFNPASVTAGSHVFSADLYLNSDVYLVLKQTLQTAGSDIVLSLQTQQPCCDGGPVLLLVTATSDFGIKLVSVAIDGVTVGSLTAPNYPPCPGCGGTTLYGFSETAKSGTHTVTVTATDGNNQTASLDQQVVFGNPPSLTLTAPAYDGSLVNGSLTISGTAKTDKTTGLTTVAYLNSVEIFKTKSSPFTTNYSLAGVTPGAYTLVVETVDANGLTATVSEGLTVTSSPSLVYPLFAFGGDDGGIVTAENATLLYEAPDGSMHLRTGTNDITLQNPVGVSIGGPSIDAPWILSNGYAFDSSPVSCCGANPVYAWSPAGVPQDLSGAASNDTFVAAHYPWVLWLSSSFSTYTFFNISTLQTITVPAPAGTTGFAISLASSLPWPTDFFTGAGGLTLYYAAVVTSNTAPIYVWTQNSGTSTLVPNTTGPNLPGLQTDGVRAAWEYSLASTPTVCNATTLCYGLDVLDIATNTVQSISQDATQFYLANGLLGWQETSPQGGGIKVSDGTTTTVLSDRLSTRLWGVSNGHVLYQDEGKLYVWSAASGSVLLYDAVPTRAAISSGTSSTTVFFQTQTGAQVAIYSVPLN